MRVLPKVLPLIAPAIALFAVGCAKEQMKAPVAELPPRSVPAPSTASLAFTPPVAVDFVDDLDLNRAGRAQFASAGFETEIVNESYVRQDDRQRYDQFGDEGHFERRAVNTTIKISRR